LQKHDERKMAEEVWFRNNYKFSSRKS